MSSRKNSWLVTYSDMVTLLMAFFLCILTFSSLAGARKRGGLERDSVVWRPRLKQKLATDSGAAMAPMYRDPSRGMTDRILQALEGAADEKSADNFAIRLPLSLLFDNDEQLSSSGKRLLHALADNLRELPWDLQLQVSHADDTPRAVQVCQFLLSQEGYEPARLAVGARRPRDGEGDFVWLVLCRQF
ncbi:MAG TPA: flagellar motor protein MotB [Gemmataceae bacterium]|nr:flagellar motor protein MotB [Gemmataceae bacterium]